MNDIKKNILVITFLVVICVVFFSRLSYFFFADYSTFKDWYPNYGRVLWFGKLFFLLFTLIFGFYLRKKQKFKFFFKSTLYLMSQMFIRKYIRYFFYLFIFLIATYLRFAYNRVLIIDSDANGYIEPALDLLKNGTLSHESRSYPYPLFVYFNLYFFKNINAILFTQHIIALLSLTGTIIFLEKLYTKNRNNLYSALLYLILGYLFMIMCFWNPPIILLEQTLRPEGLLMSSFILTIYLIWKFHIKSKYDRSSIFLLLTITGVFLILAYLHIRMSIAYYIIILIMVVVFFYNNKDSWDKKTIYLLSLLLLVLLIMIPEERLKSQFDKGDEFAYRQFYFSNLNTVAKAVKNKDYVLPSFDSLYVEKMYELSLNPPGDIMKVYKILGFELDYAQYILLDEYTYQFEQSVNANRFKNGIFGLIRKRDRIPPDYFERWFWKFNSSYKMDLGKKLAKQLYYYFLSPELSIMHFRNNKETIRQIESLEMNNYFRVLESEFSFNPNETIRINTNKSFEYINISPLIVKVFLFITLLYYSFNLLLFKVNIFEILIGILLFFTIITVGYVHSFDITRYIICIMPILLFFTFYFMGKLMINIFDLTNKGA